MWTYDDHPNGSRRHLLGNVIAGWAIVGAFLMALVLA